LTTWSHLRHLGLGGCLQDALPRHENATRGCRADREHGDNSFGRSESARRRRRPTPSLSQPQVACSTGCRAVVIAMENVRPLRAKGATSRERGSKWAWILAWVGRSPHSWASSEQIDTPPTTWRRAPAGRSSARPSPLRHRAPRRSRPEATPMHHREHPTRQERFVHGASAARTLTVGYLYWNPVDWIREPSMYRWLCCSSSLSM
jgi:hypothetical protein